jgi:RNase P subunit RPR2
METTTAPAVARSWWTCRNCRRTLGEVVGTQLVVKVRGEDVFLSAVAYAARTCPGCGALNERDGRPAGERRETA